jgi:hypothetical protein
MSQKIYTYDDVKKIVMDFIEKASYCTIEVRHGDYNIVFRLEDGREMALGVLFYNLDNEDEDIKKAIERCRKR